jgi:hypothetical protein
MRTYLFTFKLVCLFLLSIGLTQFKAAAQAPTLVYAKTLGQANQVTLLFSEPVSVPSGVSGFAINNSASVTGVAQGDNASTLVLTTTGLTVGGSFTLTINGVQGTNGVPIAAGTQAAIDFTVYVPLEFGQTVTGFQDNFNSATIDPDWNPDPSDNMPFTQSGGMLHMTTITNITGEDPVHLFYEPASGYSSDTQEVLMRMRINTLTADAVGGVAVGGDPVIGGEAANLYMTGVASPTGNLVVDGGRGSLALSGFTWQTNTWYWLRLLMSTASPGPDSENLFAKIWLGDGSAPEPLEWQQTFVAVMADGDELYAGIEAPFSGAAMSFDVDYFLLETPDLPSITVTPNAFTLADTIYLSITNQPVSEFVPPGQNGTFTANAVGSSPVTVQWQVAPSNSTTFANIQGATNTTLTVSNVLAPQNGNQYRAVFTASGIVATSVVAVLTTDATPILFFARTGGSNGQVIVQFSEAIVMPSVTNFSINNGISVTAVTPGPTSNEVILAVSPLSLNTTYTLSATDISDNYGDVLASAQALIDFRVYLPVDFGTTVSGFQDDFSEATINPNWVIFADSGNVLNSPAPADTAGMVVQTNGELYFGYTADYAGGGYNPLGVVYAPSTPYNGTNQEILARILVTYAAAGPYYNEGVCVCADPNGDAIAWILTDGGAPNALLSPGCSSLDDYVAWGPAEYYPWVFNTWYWLRESQLNGTTSFKLWLADGATPEPADWDITWPGNTWPAGYAGFKVSTAGAYSAYQASYVLIKASGLPSVVVGTTNVFSFAFPMNTLTLSQTGPGSLTLQWGGDATAVLQSAPTVTGPWTAVPGATSPYIISTAAPSARFFRVKE